MTTALALFAAFLFLAAFFACSEAAILNLSKVARAHLQDAEGRTDRQLAALLERPQQLLAALLLGNGLARLGVVLAGAAAVAPMLPDASPAARVGVSVAMIFPVLLLIGVVTPRVLGSRAPEPLARLLVWPLTAFQWLSGPLGRLLTRVAQAFGRPDLAPPEETLDEKEFRTLVDAGTDAGVLQTQERTLIHNVLDFGDRRVKDLMTPHARLFSVSDKTPVPEVVRDAARRKYSRIPVWRRDPRDVVGVLYAKDLLAMRWELTPPKPLRALLRRPLYVLPQMRAEALLESFRRNRTHLAVVVDEAGRAQGICTMEDLLEELFGPITDIATERKGDDAP